MKSTENHDGHVYNWIMFERETVDFVLRAIDFYISLLGDESRELAEDSDLCSLITEDTRRELGLGRDKERATRLAQWIRERAEQYGDSYHVDISLSHGTIRFIKAAALLYLAQLKARRNVLASRSNVTAATLSAVDREISRKEELFSSAGVFKNATPVPLLASFGLETVKPAPAGKMAISAPESLLTAARPRPVLVDSIEILDHELKARCLDLFNQFQEAGQSDRNDTVVAEASRILENRLRSFTACEGGSTAKQLVTLAFNTQKPMLRVSAIVAEQEAVQLLFLGTFGFIRNQVQHKLLGNLPAERVLQILGWVDYLLSVVEQAERIENAP
ncbi:TIGR02391 family protein [Limnobacter sp. MED105]|uniref:TIGR02391 family protein n=1 Tax=Limnobacter sp. MED105 TaxID=391597 RepID=UPI000156C061|nr:TIGR02391 family protein [Limnobacter sp. MED105]EDM82230.1 hypothetical protein LMED105_14490 [Limnobacter sp. MED105]